MRRENHIQNKFSTVEVLAGDLGTMKLSNLPESNCALSMVEHNGKILLCGGLNNYEKCLQLDHGTWKEHSTLNRIRILHSAVTTQTATFVFGGLFRSDTYEYLPKDSNTWLMGKTRIPGGFLEGSAIAVDSGNMIWLIGGSQTCKRILSFSVNDHTFRELPFQLNVGRVGHRCAFIPNTNKIIVTGGADIANNYSKWFVNSTEIIDAKDGSVTMASRRMNNSRKGHGIGVVTINGVDRVAVIGGKFDSVELYNTKTKRWENTKIKLNEPKMLFGFLTVKLSDVISYL